MTDTRVLVVDDSELTRTVLRRELTEAGFNVAEACDGAEGAAAALQTRPDVVVTDLEMPVMNGFQLSRLLKNDPSTAYIPIVILTSHTESASKFWGFDSGADAYVTKDEASSSLGGVLRHLVDASERPEVEEEHLGAGAIDVLARVAQQLDAGLMEAKLLNRVLEIGVDKGGLVSAVRTLLALFDTFIDADLFAMAVLENESVRAHLYRPTDSKSGMGLREVTRFLKATLGAPDAVVEAVQIDGTLDDKEPDLKMEDAFRIDFALRQARGCLALWPRNAEEFEGLPKELLLKVLPPAGLVIDNVRLAEHLWELSTHDELTGLLNHRAIIAKLSEEMERRERYGSSCSVILGDVDKFKNINDTYGHPVGDVVLREVAKRLQLALRTTDAIGRYGGEEFLIVLPNSDDEHARQAARRLCEGLRNEAFEEIESGITIRVTASFGVASAEELAADASDRDLLSLADSRLYKAKSAGRACVVP
ncbi:MAG: diguanylate cyclase [bacterium]|nr:diguanylate cyclase [bacterium]